MSDVSYAPPVVEDQEMSRVREIFDRALNALVDASSLAKAVESLKTDLDGLKVQVQHYRNTIANQDDQITRLRQDRDAARTAQYQAEDSVRHMTSDLENTKREAQSLADANVRLNDRITELTKARDDAEYKALELSEANTALSKKVEGIRSMLGFAPEPKPEPFPEPVVQPVADTRPEYEPPVVTEVQSPTESGYTGDWQNPEPPTNPPEPSNNR